MSQYQPPLHEIAFLLKNVFRRDMDAIQCNSDIDADTVLAIAEEAGKFATERLDLINRRGDKEGARWTDSKVVMPEGFKGAYQAFCAGGWNGVKFPEQYGGQGLSSVVATVVDEMWHAANFSFALCPMLTNGAIEALLTAASDEVKNRFLPKLVSGQWTGTMNLTESQAGSDLAAIQAKAVPQPGGTYRLFGQKIFITYGEHDYTENIVHLVLARTPDAPKGVKGISLFVVPKVMVNDDGSLGARNDVRCASIEHKLGIHASPTAVMLFGEGAGAIGYLVGQENRGLETMFIMMNEARFAVGLQGLAISERAYQHALWYAQERVQGRAIGDDGSQGKTILRHPDVRRMLLSMKSQIEAMRALAIYVASRKDLTHAAISAETKGETQARVELLIPVVKGWFTETAQRVTYDALQVFGGMGFVEETGVAQYYRDARIATIYEGTTAIQANDMVGRKTLRDGGRSAFSLIEEMLDAARDLQALEQSSAQGLSQRLVAGCEALGQVVTWMLEQNNVAPRVAYAGAVPYLELWGIVCGGWMHALRVRAAAESNLPADEINAIACSSSFFSEHVLSRAPVLASAIRLGADSALNFPDTQWQR